MIRLRLTTSERIASVLTLVPAFVVVAAYAIDTLGFRFRPGAMLALGGAAAVACWLLTTSDVEDRQPGETLTFLGLVAAVTAWLLWIARPGWLPLGSGPDLTHHLLLIRYIETHWTLVHDPGAGLFLGEMSVYTPGSHLLAALTGAWTGREGLFAVHPLMAAALALKLGFVFLIACRTLPDGVARVPIAAAAAVSLFAAQPMLLGSFLQYSFFSQVVAEVFAVALWWAVIVWSARPSTTLAVVMGLLGAATFLSWPLLVGPPMLVLALLTVLGRAAPWTARLRGALIASLITGLFALLFTVGRTQFAIIAGAPGSTIAPAVAAYGWPLLVVSVAGIGLSTLERRTWPVAMMAAAVLTQAAGLLIFARMHNNVPYMAQKMFFLLLFVQGVAAAVALGHVARWLLARRRSADSGTRGTAAVAWALALAIALIVTRPLAGAPQTLRVPHEPAITAPLARAGAWAAARLPKDCVEYLVPSDESAYWLHLAVLGNPRAGARTGDSRTYELVPALIRWLTPGGLPYAIMDLTRVPRGIVDDVDVLERFDSVVVAQRRNAAACPAASQTR